MPTPVSIFFPNVRKIKRQLAKSVKQPNLILLYTSTPFGYISLEICLLDGCRVAFNSTPTLHPHYTPLMKTATVKV